MSTITTSIIRAVVTVCYALWSAGVLALAIVALDTARTWHPNPVAIAFGVAGCAAGALNLTAAGCLLVRGSRCRTMMQRSIPWGFAAVFTLVAVRLALPLEDPETGAGSPVASIFSALILGAFLMIIGLLPGLLIWAGLLRSYPKSRPEGDTQ